MVSPRFRTTGPMLPAALAVVAALFVCGCESYRIDPTGESLFIRDPAGVEPGTEGPASPMTGSVGASAPSTNLPGLAPTADLRPSLSGVRGVSIRPGSGPILLVSPQSTIAPVGSEVVMLASYLADDGYLRTNEEVQWSLDGHGSIMTVAPGGWNDWIFMDYTCSRRLSEQSAVTTTTRRLWTVDRGTPDPSDDVQVLRGQTWITLRSATSGVSHVTALAPSIENWNRRSQTGTIYWVDAQWTLPSPGIAPVGQPQTLTTTLTRQTNQAPIEGWRVRYEITGGPAAGLAQSGAQIVEVPTNELGQARVELRQTSPASGTNTIKIEIIRPAGVAGCDRSLVVGSGSVTQTWSGGAAASALSIETTGPASATLGETAVYRLTVRNQGSTTVPEALVTLPIPEGMNFVSANPMPTVKGRTLEWTLGSLAPGSQQEIDVNLRVESPGAMTVRAEVTPRTTGTPIGGAPPPSPPSTYDPTPLPTEPESSTPQIDLNLTGPQTGEVGKIVEFVATIANRGSSPTGPMILRDRFDEGLSMATVDIPDNPLDRNLDSLAAGESIDISIYMKVENAGNLCNEVKILRAETRELLATSSACLEATGTPPSGETTELPSVGGGTSPSPGDGTGATRPSDLEVEIEDPPPLREGESQILRFWVKNFSAQSQGPFDFQVIVSRPPLKVTNSTEGSTVQPSDGSLVWSIESINGQAKSLYEVKCDVTEANATANLVGKLYRDGRLIAQDELSTSTLSSGGDETGPGVGSEFDTETPIGSTGRSDQDEPPVEMIVSSDQQSADGTISAARGDQFTVLVSVTPQPPQGLTNLEVRFSLPENLRLDRLRTTGPSPYSAEGNEIIFRPIYNMPSGQTATYRLRLIAKQSGSGSLEATARSVEYPGGLRRSVPVTVAP